MSEQEIREVVLRALHDVAPEVDFATVAADAPLRGQVDIDSVDYLRVLVALNEALHVEVPETDYARIATIDALVAYLAQKVGAGAA